MKRKLKKLCWKLKLNRSETLYHKALICVSDSDRLVEKSFN